MIADVFNLPVLDGVASIGIGLILAATAIFLAYETKALLIGEAADPSVEQGIREIVAHQETIRNLNELRTMHMGPDDVLMALSIDFFDHYKAGTVEQTIYELERSIKKVYPQIRRLYIEVQSEEHHDLVEVEKAQQREAKLAKTGNKDAIKLSVFLEVVHAHLDEGKPARSLTLDKDEQQLLKPLCLLTAKPAIFVANVDDNGFENNPLLTRVQEYAASEGAPVVAICASLEAEIAELPDEDKQIFLADINMEEPGLNRLARAAYKLLGLQTYFTAGVKEVRAWTMCQGDTAPQAAGVIHTDFERGFIRAEVIAYEDYITYKGEQGSKEAGKMRLEGKEYIVKDGDVMHFRFNV